MIIGTDQLHAMLELAKTSRIEIARAVGAQPVALPLTPGEQVLAEIIAKLPSGSDLVRIKGGLMAMELPENIPPGERINLTFLAASPRPLFALSQSLQQGTPVEITPLSRWLSEIVSEKNPNHTASTVKPILDKPAENSEQISSAIKQQVSSSGLFYEKHLSRWARGDYPLKMLLKEPQGALSLIASSDSGTEQQLKKAAADSPDEPADSRTAAAVKEQLGIINSRSFSISTELLPGIPLDYTIEERYSGSAKDEREEGKSKEWHSSMKLQFDHLGDVAVEISVNGKFVGISLKAKKIAALTNMRSRSDELLDSLESRGLTISSFKVSE